MVASKQDDVGVMALREAVEHLEGGVGGSCVMPGDCQFAS